MNNPFGGELQLDYTIDLLGLLGLLRAGAESMEPTAEAARVEATKGTRVGDRLPELIPRRPGHPGSVAVDMDHFREVIQGPDSPSTG